MSKREIDFSQKILRPLAVGDIEVMDVDERARTLWHPITREVPDRYGDIVRIDGIDTSDFMRKPAVLYGHDYRSMNPVPVIGKGLGFEKRGDTFWAQTQFLPAEGLSKPLADLVNDNWVLHARKLLGWSIGFMPDGEPTLIDNGKDAPPSFDFENLSLLEYSSVIIPAHQDAVDNAIKGGEVSGAVRKYFDMALPTIGAGEAPKEKDVGEPKAEVEEAVEAKGVIPYHDYGAEDANTPWDGGAAMKADPAVLKKICAWYDAENADVKSSYKLPHHDPSSLKANRNGVNNAKARLPNTDIPEGDKAGVEAHLTKHQAAWKDIEPQTQETAPVEIRPEVVEESIPEATIETKGDIMDPETKDIEVETKDVKPVRKLELGDAVRRDINAVVGGKPENDEERDIQKFNDEMLILGTIMQKNPRQLKAWDSYLNRSGALKKTVSTLAEATSNVGAEWVPTLVSANFIERMRLAAKVAPLFDDFAMPSNPWKRPYTAGLTYASFVYVAESTTDAATGPTAINVATADKTLTAYKMKARVLFSDEIEEDSIVPVIPYLNAELPRAMAEAWDDAIINGQKDAGSGVFDTDVTASTDLRLAFNGLRYASITLSSLGTDMSTFTTANFAASLAAMGKYGVDVGQLAIVTGSTGYHKFRALAEVLTVDKYGPSATILNGELGKILGIPIVVSEQVRLDVSATGKHAASSNTYTTYQIVYRPGIMLGSRGGVKLSLERDPAIDQNQLIISQRKAIQYTWTPSATVTVIGGGIKIS